MAGKPIDAGPIGSNAAAVVRHLRQQRRLSYAELSRMVESLGRSIPPLGLRRIEAGERRIDIDDLVALALALEVSPLRLLLPTEISPLVTNGVLYEAHRIWDWGTGKWPLSGDEVTFVRDSHPLRWAQTMTGREAGDAMDLKRGAEAVQRGIERDGQAGRHAAGE